MRTCYPMIIVMCLVAGLDAADGPAATGSLTIKVMDEEGKPVDLATVQLRVKTDTGASGFEFATHPTGTAGVFRVPGIPAGRYEGVRVNKSGFAPGWVPDVQIDAGLDTPVACTLSRGGTIEGYVNDESGAPLAGIPVVVNSVLCRRDVVTDAAGRFLAEHLADTEYKISAEPRADSPYGLMWVKGTVHCGAKDVRVVLRPKADTTRPLVPVEQDVKTLRGRDRLEEELGAASLRSTLQAREALIGKPAPALVAEQWHNGSFWQLSLKGKVVLLDFWGVWCKPCRQQLPQIRALAVKYADRGLVVIGVHTQSAKEDLPSFLSHNDLPYLIAVDYNNKTPEAYRVAGYPTIALIDRKGVLRAFDPGGLEKSIVALLAENE